MKKYVSKFHYLTQDLQQSSHPEQALAACQAGANWVQYRCLNKSDKELMKEIAEVAVICDDWGATLIITNHYHLLDKVDVQGVHIESMAASLGKIRSIIGGEKTLGASANSFNDIKRIYREGAADYIGCGPYAFTSTKVNDYRLLGIEGYTAIVNAMKEESIDIPVIAVGGIDLDAAEDLLETGIYGIAVSSAVNLATEPKSAIKEFRRFFS